MRIKEKLVDKARQGTQRLGSHRDIVDRGIDKVGALADNKTSGRYGRQIRRGKEQLRTGLDKLADSAREHPGPTQAGSAGAPTHPEAERDDGDGAVTVAAPAR